MAAVLLRQSAESDIESLTGSEKLVVAAPGKKQRRGAYALQNQMQAPSGNAVEVIASLRPRAEAGDAKAAYAIYLKLHGCETAFGQNISDEEIKKYEMVGASEGLLEDRMTALEECKGIEGQLRERGRWLEQAAAAGLLEAQLLYATDPKPIIGDAADMIRDPQKVQQYKTKAVGYLNQLATQGNIDAMTRLASAYNNGILVRRDAVQSYAYYRAVELAAPGTIPGNLLARQRSQIAANDVRRAEQLASQLYQRCCGN